MIEKIDLNKESKNEMKRLYARLCDYVHPSDELVQKVLTDDQYFFKFDSSQYDSLLEIYSQTCDLIISLTFSRFPKAIERLFQETIDSLRVEGYLRTAEACEIEKKNR